MNLDLFPHNKAAYHAASRMLEDEGKAAIVHPTGTGKSFIAFQLCADYPDKTVCWLSPSAYIFRTQLENLTAVTGGEQPENIHFFTYAKLMSMEPEEMSEIRPDYIILDEFHRCGAEMWGQGVDRLLHMYPDAKLLGLSATSVRYLDGQRNMADELFDGNVAIEMTLGEAIVRGILPAPKYVVGIYSYQKELEKYQHRIQRAKSRPTRDAAQVYLDALRRKLEMADGLDVMFRKHMTDRSGKYLVFCANKEHMDELLCHASQWFGGVDPEPHVYRAYSEDPETSQAFAAFKADGSAHLRLLFCIDMLNEGIHTPDVSGVILFRPTVSPTVYKQQIGRALSCGSAQTPLILDVVNNVENLYSIGTIQEEMQAAITYYRYLGGGDIVQERFEIIDEVRECRQLFARLEDSLSVPWEHMFVCAAAFYREHGHLNVPKHYKTPEGYSLGAWLQTQRRVHSGSVPGTLTEEQVRRLDGIGMVWDVQQQRWEKYFAALKAYKGAYGDVDIKKDYVDPQGIALGNWVYNLRGYRASGLRLSYLTEERIRQLDELGFIWSKVDSQWEMNFQAAQDYYRKHGDLEVPAAYISPDGLKLGVWIQSVRYNRKKPGKGKPLTERQIATLDAIGMNWTGKLDRSFANGMVHAQEYFRANGDLNVTRSCCSPDGFRLGEWVANQRERYRRGSMPEQHKKKIESMGMVWERPDSWNTKYAMLESYYKTHGNISIPSTYEENGVWLGRWLSEQRQIYHGKREGKHLTENQINQLDSLGMLWIPNNDTKWLEMFQSLVDYGNQNHNFDVPADFEQNPRPRRWVQRQQSLYRKNSLAAWKTEKFLQLGLLP